jgi:SAM-dependent methyltransferase
MSEPFGPDYAEAYDLLYADKDYDAECDYLEEAFRASGRTVRTVLDLGCGTGAHAVRLAQRGYSVVGVDISAPMLQLARERAGDAGVQACEFVLGDVRDVRIGRTFDAVTSMFAVLGYQTSDEDVQATLETVRTHLGTGAPFVFDVWYGPAVEATGPEERVKVVQTSDGQLERSASAVLEQETHTCTVSYKLSLRRSGLQDRRFDESHRVRYFFADELGVLLKRANLDLIDVRAFPDTLAEPSEASWNIIATAAAV